MGKTETKEKSQVKGKELKERVNAENGNKGKKTGDENRGKRDSEEKRGKRQARP